VIAGKHDDELRSYRRAIQTRKTAAMARSYRGFHPDEADRRSDGKTAIDIACGEGFYTRMIRQQGAVKVTGVDLSEKNDRAGPGQRSRNSGWGSITS